MKCRVSGLVKSVPGWGFFVVVVLFFLNGFILKDCCIPKIPSLFQQKF